MADDMEEIDVASLLMEMSTDRLFIGNLFLTSGQCEEIDVTQLIQEIGTDKVYFVPLFLSTGQNEEINVADLVQEFDAATRVMINPIVNTGAMDQIGFTGVQGMEGDTLSLIDFVTYQQANVNRQRRIKLISVI